MINEEDTRIRIDFKDWHSLIDLMKHNYDYPFTLFGTNEDNEDMFVDINEDNIKTETFQMNGYTRINIYHRNGILEELYERAMATTIWIWCFYYKYYL